MNIQELFHSYQESIDYFFEKVDTQQVQKVVEWFKDCKGLLVFSGVGKSGLVAQKIAATLTSTGTRAIFLSPLEALHGDIGVIGQDDLFIAMSKNGEAEELLQLIPFVRKKGAKVLAFVSNPQSKLARAADLVLQLPVHKELCPYNLAPTISTTVQMVLGDVLAIAMMQERSFSMDQYALNHPSGSIGKKLTLKVEDLMVKGAAIPVADPEDRVIDILVELSNKKAGCVLVLDKEGVLLGIFTDGDLRRSLQVHGEVLLQKKMRDVMTSGGRTIAPHSLAWEAMQVMEGNQKQPIMVLPVVDADRKVLGLLRMHDVLQSGL